MFPPLNYPSYPPTGRNPQQTGCPFYDMQGIQRTYSKPRSLIVPVYGNYPISWGSAVQCFRSYHSHWWKRKSKTIDETPWLDDLSLGQKGSRLQSSHGIFPPFCKFAKFIQVEADLACDPITSLQPVKPDVVTEKMLYNKFNSMAQTLSTVVEYKYYTIRHQ